MSSISKNYTGAGFKNKAPDFDAPTKLPQDESQQVTWQNLNKAWWEATPMRYDWREDISFPPDTREYFEEIDNRFLSSVRTYLPWRKLPFEQLIPFATLAQLDVLEIGVGQGTHAQLIAPHCRSFTGIDLTEVASRSTRTHLELLGITATIEQMDAEAMTFPDAAFDYVWSWGVIHHSANTRRVLSEMQRVLRPGGRATVMVYHRNWWNYYVAALLRGIARGKLRWLGNRHSLAQEGTDGAIARFYRAREWEDIVLDLFKVEKISVYGLKGEILPLPGGRLKSALERLLPDSFGRFMTSRLRMGGFLVAEMVRL
jgi:ubiquinone/menaquinone biosynthesis C-methylase UbiE